MSRRRSLDDSEGARLLRSVLDDERSDDVARAAGVTRQCIDHLAGLRRRYPELPLALRLARRYGIPVDAWTQAPKADVATGVSRSAPTLIPVATDDSAA